MIFDDSASHGMFVLELGGRGKRLPEIDSLDADHPVSGERERGGGNLAAGKRGSPFRERSFLVLPTP
jgi:hypothetical protein